MGLNRTWGNSNHLSIVYRILSLPKTRPAIFPKQKTPLSCDNEVFGCADWQETVSPNRLCWLVRCDFVGGMIFEIEAHLKLVATDQTDSFFLGDTFMGDCNFVVFPRFPSLQLTCSIDPCGSIAFGLVVGFTSFGSPVFLNMLSLACPF